MPIKITQKQKYVNPALYTQDIHNISPKNQAHGLFDLLGPRNVLQKFLKSQFLGAFIFVASGLPQGCNIFLTIQNHEIARVGANFVESYLGCCQRHWFGEKILVPHNPNIICSYKENLRLWHGPPSPLINRVGLDCFCLGCFLFSIRRAMIGYQEKNSSCRQKTLSDKVHRLVWTACVGW